MKMKLIQSILISITIAITKAQVTPDFTKHRECASHFTQNVSVRMSFVEKLFKAHEEGVFDDFLEQYIEDTDPKFHSITVRVKHEHLENFEAGKNARKQILFLLSVNGCYDGTGSTKEKLQDLFGDHDRMIKQLHQSAFPETFFDNAVKINKFKVMNAPGKNSEDSYKLDYHYSKSEASLQEREFPTKIVISSFVITLALAILVVLRKKRKKNSSEKNESDIEEDFRNGEEEVTLTKEETVATHLL